MCRQCQGVCRRWRRVWFSEPGLWQRLRLGPPSDAEVQLAIVQRVAPLLETLEVRGTGEQQQTAGQQGTAQWQLPKLLASLPVRRRQRLQELRLSTETVEYLYSPYEFWVLRDCKPLSAAAMRKVGRLRALRALELDSWQLPHCTADVLGRLTQLSRLRLRARQLPASCLVPLTSS